MDNSIHTKWFEDWFDSPYYHILYKQRNTKEAELFIDNLIIYLQPPENARFLDLGCGKGRHSIYLNKKKFDVTGFDLSANSIDFAKKLENNTLHFYIQDMRKPFTVSHFDYIVNMFTSFGYFEKEEDNFDTIKEVSNALKPDGTFVLDFMNVEKIIPCIIPNNSITIEGIEFTIHKKVENNFIIKEISFIDNNKKYNYEERVKILTLADFKEYFAAAKLEITNLRGDYLMNEFNPLTSDRLILIAKKK